MVFHILVSQPGILLKIASNYQKEARAPQHGLRLTGTGDTVSSHDAQHAAARNTQLF